MECEKLKDTKKGTDYFMRIIWSKFSWELVD